MSLLEQNLKRWQNCSVPADKGPAFAKVADRIKANKAVYDKIEAKTGVPWWFIGITHYRESNLNMSKSLAQGDPWNKVSTHVPAGRGPFKSFEDAAVDALVNCAPYAARNKDWSVGNALTMFEKYNGLGYAKKGIPSPYVWAGTNQYVAGKYVADGVFDPHHVDKQLGCAGILKFLGVFNTKSGVPSTAGGVAATAGTFVALQEYFAQHPYIAAGLAVAIGLGIWGLIRWYRNQDA